MRHIGQAYLERCFAKAGILLDGTRPWDMRVTDRRVFGRVLTGGPVGLGDAYVDGWWECDALDQWFDRCLRADLPKAGAWHPGVIGRCLRERLVNLQSPRRAGRNVRAHYNLGNDLFEAMLDPRMVYSCGYWARTHSLAQAQEAKLDLICRKLGLASGMRVLDIGCGWGGLAEYAASHYGCDVVGITMSPQQAEWARRRCEGLAVDIRLQDYREVDERFDRVVSVGMFEHVGQKNHRSYMNSVRRCLGAEGLCLLHFFATQRPWPNRLDSEVIWVARHIFPGMVVPTLGQVGRALEDSRFVVEDLQNFGADYDPTLMAWFDNFDRNWPKLRESYGERFYRMWKYYLRTCAGAFRSRKYQVWQMVLSPAGVPGGYRVRPGYDLSLAAPIKRPEPLATGQPV